MNCIQFVPAVSPTLLSSKTTFISGFAAKPKIPASTQMPKNVWTSLSQLISNIWVALLWQTVVIFGFLTWCLVSRRCWAEFNPFLETVLFVEIYLSESKLFRNHPNECCFNRFHLSNLFRCITNIWSLHLGKLVMDNVFVFVQPKRC